MLIGDRRRIECIRESLECFGTQSHVMTGAGDLHMIALCYLDLRDSL